LPDLRTVTRSRTDFSTVKATVDLILQFVQLLAWGTCERTVNGKTFTIPSTARMLSAASLWQQYSDADIDDKLPAASCV
jgi:hypothetical protein